MELGAPAQKDARLEMTQLRDVLYVLQLFEVTQFLAENATCPPPFTGIPRGGQLKDTVRSALSFLVHRSLF